MTLVKQRVSLGCFSFFSIFPGDGFYCHVTYSKGGRRFLSQRWTVPLILLPCQGADSCPDSSDDFLLDLALMPCGPGHFVPTTNPHPGYLPSQVFSPLSCKNEELLFFPSHTTNRSAAQDYCSEPLLDVVPSTYCRDM